MDSFCGGEPIWNSTLMWSDNRTWPEFTDCFQNTVLVWTCSGWLLVTLPFYLHYMLQQRTEPIPSSWRNLSKLAIALFQLILCILISSYEASEITRKAESYWQASFVGPVIQVITLVLVMILLELERRKGFITSGVLFIYWLLVVITSVIPFYSKLIQEDYTTDLLVFTVFYVYFGLSLIQLVLSCFAEQVLVESTGKAPCPEVYASFLSRITFNWISKLVVAGYKKTLTEQDLYQLNPRDQSRTVVPKFEKQWKKQTERSRIAHEKQWNGRYMSYNGSTHTDDADCVLSESTPLIRNSSTSGKTTDTSHKQRTSLSKVLFRTFGWEVFTSNIWKLFYDILIFINPVLLRLLIDFSEDSGRPIWQGYVFSGGFFLVTLAQSVLFHQLFHKTYALAIRLRAALVTAIFTKSMTMNNHSRTESTVGEIVNLMSVDAEHLRDMCGYLWGVWSCPLQIVVALVFLYFTVGWAMLAGLGVMLIFVPVNAYITGKVQKLQVEQMAFKDKRIKLITEVLNGIKILKLYAWEMAFGEKVTALRKEELRLIRKASIITAFMTFSWTVAPFTVGLATFATYIFIQENHYLDAQTAFVAISLFNILRFALNLAPLMIMEAVKAYVSIKRMDKFLNQDDLDFTNVSHDPSDDAIKIENGCFSWDPELGVCLRNINLKIPKGSLVAVVGQVGMGKSSLISAILGEMEKNSGHVNVDGTTAYVPQQAWIQNATVRDNILFGKTMNGNLYSNVIDACSLQDDLDILAAKDLTEIGEKGINLSGGQRQRVSLARSVYFDSEIYLLDDPLSAVDSHVGKHIFQEVIGKDGLLKDKTRVLVTHGLQWLPSVDCIIVMNDGLISETGSYEELMEHDGPFAQFLRTYLLSKNEANDEEDIEVQTFKVQVLERLVSIQSDSGLSDGEPDIRKRLRSTGQSDDEHKLVTVEDLKRTLSHTLSSEDRIKISRSVEEAAIKHTETTADTDTGTLRTADRDRLIEEEKLETGGVSLSVLMTYIRSIGTPFAVLLLLLYGSYQAASVVASIWLTNWTSDPDLLNLELLPGNSTERRNKNDYYLGVYGALGVVQAILVMSYAFIAIIRMVRAARLLHHNMLINILRCPMSFFDTTPIGRIVNRFSQDTEAIDRQIPLQVEAFLDCLFICLSTLVVILYTTPIFVTVIVPICVLYFVIQRFYIPTSRQLKRLESKTRSPIYNNFSESLTGANVIRAFRVQDRFAAESEKRVDHNQEYAFANYVINRWLGFRLELLGATVVLAAALFAVVERENITASLVGLSVSYALQITENMNWLVRMVSELETNLVNVERVRQYTTIPTEAALVTSKRPQKDWPETGTIQVQNYGVRYREGLDLVLRGVTFTVKAGEKVGIVGRTGAGKSSLTTSLFRIVEAAEGSILIDGKNINDMGLYDLRSRLTILPQEPVLFSGSLRVNLDPMDEHTDRALWVALEHAHLKSYVEQLPAGLEYEVGEGGQNLSVGQRQLVCLSRSLLKKSKILILDEATAAVDMETDELIQKTISTEFKDCTVLTIAHRLNTIMDYDRILVLDKGEVKEFEPPQTLLQNPKSLFYSMAKDAGLV